MKTIALLSGGKDSLLSVLVAMRYGHTPLVVANMRPVGEGESVHEVDSYMFQTVGHEVVDDIARCMQLPIRRSPVRRGQAREQSLSYSATPPEDDEVEAMYRLLKAVKEEFPEVAAVTTGAILSNYQRNRVELVCARLGLVSLAYLWQRPAREVLDMTTSLRVRAILVKAASVGLQPEKLLGKTLEEARPTLERMEDQYGSHMAGEGGEFETIVLDCPLYKEEALDVKSMHVVMVDENVYAPSGHCVLSVERVAKSASSREADADVMRSLLDTLDGVRFLSDRPAHLPEAETLAAAVGATASDARENRAPHAPSVFAFMEACIGEMTGVQCRPFTGVGDTAGAFAAAAAWVATSGTTALACCVTCAAADWAAATHAYEAFAPTLNPPTLSVTDAASAGVVVGVVACDCRDAGVTRQVLHAQSLSCWAAGLPGARYSQAWALETRRSRVVAAHGVRGVVPTTGCLASAAEAAVLEPALGDLALSQERKQHVALLACQLAYAYANAAAYTGFYRVEHLGDAQTNVCVCVTTQEDVEIVPVLWRWCTGQTSAAEAQSRMACTVCDALPDGALVEVTVVHTTVLDVSESDDDGQTA